MLEISSVRAVAKSFPPLSPQGGKGFIKMIGEFASSMSDMACSEPREQSQHGVVEYCEHLRSMSHAQLRMIFSHGSIPSIMQSVFDPPMPSAQRQETFGVGQVRRQARHPIADLRCGDTKRIGPLAFQFEDLSQFRQVL